MTINATNTVGELAVTMPGATRVFEQFGIDYCCGGRRTLSEACRTRKVQMEDVVRSLEAARQTPDDSRDWRQESLASLAVYIVEKHHHFTREEIERLEKLFDKVCARHGENHPELFEAQKTFYQLKLDLLPHMLKEEQVLFPYITQMETAVNQSRAVPQPFFVTVRNPVRMMMTEHDAAGELLQSLRGSTNDYTPPADACISYQTLYQALAGFEADLHQHIHLENNLLFPRAVEMEGGAAPEMQSSAGEFNEHRCFGH
ncbi:MAG: iron-sulfur cluster repair di-iron protein [Blastocatellales bacterium]